MGANFQVAKSCPNNDLGTGRYSADGRTIEFQQDFDGGYTRVWTVEPVGP